MTTINVTNDGAIQFIWDDALQPLEGFDEAYLPGGVEAAREREYSEQGIPVGPEHQQRLQELADEFGLTAPW